MSTNIVIRWGIDLTDAGRELMLTVCVVGFVFLVAMGFLYLNFGATHLQFYGALGIVACFVAAWLSGNPRLFFLWCLMIAVTVDLSKSLGPTLLFKGGGETAFRIELSDMFYLLLAAYLVRNIWNRRLAGIRIPKITYFWLLIILMGCIAMVAGDYRVTAAHESVRMIKVMILFLVLCNELDSPRRILQCGAALTFAVIAQAILGFVQYYKKGPLGLYLWGEPDPKVIDVLGYITLQTGHVYRISGTLIHPNIFGIFLAAVLPIVIAGFLLKASKAYKLLFGAGICLGMTALILTLSRSGWVGFAASFSVLMILMMCHGRLRKRASFTAGFALILLLAMCGAFYGQIASRIFDSKDSLAGRAVFNDIAERMILDAPWVGRGLNSYGFEMLPYSQFSLDAYQGWLPAVHNIYLLWAAETGVVGLFFHLAVIVGVIWVGIGNIRVKDELMFIMNAACMGGILAFVIDGFFSFSLRINPILRMFWVLAAMVMAIHYWRVRNHGHVSRFEPAPGPVKWFEQGQTQADTVS